MPRALKDYLGLAAVLLCAVVVVAIAAAAAFYVGLAWAVIIYALVGWIVARRIPAGYYGEGAFLIVIILILMAAGVVAGLLLRLVTP